MPVEVKVPEVGESITEVQIGQWRKRVGQQVAKDENLVEIESDKATVDLPAPISGTVTQILKQAGENARVGEVIGYMAAESEAPVSPPSSAAPPTVTGQATVKQAQPAGPRVMPAAERLAAQEGIRAESVQPTGPGGRTLKEDVRRAVEERNSSAAPVATQTAPPAKAELVEADLAPHANLLRSHFHRLSARRRIRGDEPHPPAALPSGWSKPSTPRPCSRRSTKST